MEKPEAKTGMGVDATGGPVIDPTRNVLDLVQAGMGRQDDMRGASSALFHALIGGLEKYIDAKIDGFKALYDSRLDNIKHEFATVEHNRIEQKNDTKVAVDAALTSAKDLVKEQGSASKEAITKSETAATSALLAVQTTVNDLKDRLGRVETELRTKAEVHSVGRSDTGMVVSVAMAVFAFLSLIIAGIAVVYALSK